MGSFASLGGSLPLINQANAAARNVRQFRGQFGNDGAGSLQLVQLQERNRLAESTATTRAGRDQALLGAELSENERRRSNALRRAVSRQRAAYGGAGVDGGDGSGEAVLLGLFNESEQERAARDDVFNLRRAIIDDNLAGLRQRNLLEESQLATRLRRRRA
jgi:hypothetical protein